MSVPKKVTITISTECGGHTIEVEREVVGAMSSGAMDLYEDLFDGHGNLLDPKNAALAKNTSNAANTLEATFRETGTD